MGWTLSYRARAAVVAAVLMSGWSTACYKRQPDREWMRLATTGSRFEASNGYLFIVVPDPAAHVVQVDVRIPVGSARDPVGKEGLAHLVEHLLFAVEVPRESGTTSISAELARLAHYWNAVTTADYTHYVAQGPPASLDGLLRLETERTLVGCRGITQAVFEREKEVVVNELRQRRGASGAVLTRRLNEALYPAGHPYRRTDSVDSVRRIQPADVCRFLAEAYPLGKAVVVVSGATTEGKVRESAGRYFVALARRNLSGLRAPPAVAPAPGRVRVRADVDELTLMASWPLPARSSRDFRLLEAVWDLIPGQLEWFARTYQWGHSAVSGVVGGHFAPQLVIAVTLDSASDLDEAVSAVEKSVRSAFRDIYRAARGSQPVRWRRTWLPVAAGLVSQYESIGGRAHLLADFAQFDPDGGGLIGRVRDLDRADPEDVRAIAERWLDPDRARFVILEPDTAAVERVSSISSFISQPEVHRVSVDPAEADRPLSVPPVSLAVPTTRYQLRSGLSVVLWKGLQTPLVRASLVVDSGTAHEPIGRGGLALLQGADEVYDDHIVFSGTDFGHELDWLVVNVVRALHDHRVGFSDQQKKLLRTRLRRALAAPRLRYEHDLLVALYGAKHPYARPGLTERSLSAIDGEALVDWRRTHVVGHNATLVVAGDVDRARLDDQLARLADRFTEGRDSPDVRARPVTSPGFILGADRAEEPLVELDVAFVGGRGIDRAYPSRVLMSEILAAKLSALREEDALSYGFSASYSPQVAGGMWRVRGKVPAARAAEAARILQRTLDEMRASPDAYRGEFVHARRKLVEALAGSGTDSAAILDRLVLIERFGLSPRFFDQLLADVAGLRIADMHSFMSSELSASRQVFGAFGPRAAAQAALDAARGQVSR